LRLTTARWLNRLSRTRAVNGEQSERWSKVLAHSGSYEQFAYGTDTPSQWQDSGLQRAIICSPGSRTIAVDVDDEAAFAATRTGQLLGRQHAISTHGPRKYHILIDARTVPPEAWPRQGPVGAPGDIGGMLRGLYHAADIKSNGFIPMPGSRHYDGGSYEPVIGADGLSHPVTAWPALIEAMCADRAEWDAARREHSASGGHGGGGGSGGGHDGEIAAEVLKMVLRGLSKEECHAEWLTIAVPRDPAWPYEREDFERHHGGAVRKAEQIRAGEAEQTAAFAASRGAGTNPGPAASGALSPAEGGDAQRAQRRAAMVTEAEDREWARREVAAREWAQAIGERAIISHAGLLAQPPPQWIMPPYLTIGVHGVAGPAEAGKSLLMRDWAVQVAATGKNALYALSEGHHDLAERFKAHPQIGDASAHLFYLTDPLSLTSDADVKWLIEQWQGRGLASAVFDMAYGFGMSDDSGMKDVAPLLGGCRRVALGLECAVVITGHPPLNGDRRFRGSGMWRGAFDSEYHMAEGLFTCEKHKYADKAALSYSYRVEFPHLVTATAMDEVTRYARQMAIIADDLRTSPGESDSARARRLAGRLKVSSDYLRRLIREAKKA
jgi:hypothetical protein